MWPIPWIKAETKQYVKEIRVLQELLYSRLEYGKGSRLYRDIVENQIRRRGKITRWEEFSVLLIKISQVGGFTKNDFNFVNQVIEDLKTHSKLVKDQLFLFKDFVTKLEDDLKRSLFCADFLDEIEILIKKDLLDDLEKYFCVGSWKSESDHVPSVIPRNEDECFRDSFCRGLNIRSAKNPFHCILEEAFNSLNERKVFYSFENQSLGIGEDGLEPIKEDILDEILRLCGPTQESHEINKVDKVTLEGNGKTSQCLRENKYLQSREKGHKIIHKGLKLLKTLLGKWNINKQNFWPRKRRKKLSLKCVKAKKALGKNFHCKFKKELGIKNKNLVKQTFFVSFKNVCFTIMGIG